MEEGTEDLNLNITSLVEEWIVGTSGGNKGIAIFLTSSIENALSSSYTKKFYTRSSEYFFLRPVIEAQWSDSKKDSRVSFYASSSLADDENLNTLYLYNYIRGQLRNIPVIDTGAIYLQMWTDSISGSNVTFTGSNITLPTVITGGYQEVGIYTASFALNTSASYVFDRWYGTLLSTCYHTGSRIEVKSMNASSYNTNPRYTLSMPNLKSVYDNEEVARLEVVSKQKKWQPNKYSVMNSDPELQIIEDLYYNVTRVTDNLEVIPFGTGSMNETCLSYDVSGSYFKFDMSLLQNDYAYEFRFKKKVDTNSFELLKDSFKFRVE